MNKNLTTGCKGTAVALVVIFMVALSSVVVAGTMTVHGDVKKDLKLLPNDLKAMPSFYINKVTMIKEKADCADEDKLIEVADFKGVLLRDILDKAGMKYTRKWEPGVYIRVKGEDNREVVFSFGEIYYSSIGRSVLVAYEKNGKPISFSNGCGMLVVSTDVRSGRTIGEIQDIEVKRVGVELRAYKDKKKKVVRPPEAEFTIIDDRTKKEMVIKPVDLEQLSQVYINAAVMTGDCEGFHGIYSFEGPPLKLILRKSGINACPPEYDRYVLVTSEDGFCTTFSMGELFNSRLSDNIVLATKKDGKILEGDGFAMSVVREDSTGGRSVKRIQKIIVY